MAHAKAGGAFASSPWTRFWACISRAPACFWIGERYLVEESVRPTHDGIGDGNPNHGNEIGQGKYLGP